MAKWRKLHTCGITGKLIFRDETEAQHWSDSKKDHYDITEPYRDPRCGHIHLRNAAKHRERAIWFKNDNIQIKFSRRKR